jgi:aspartyl-tRNA(Asn)/glutamyl-tRNA(Gln) amidotransferase subunit A
MINASLSELARALATKRISSSELTRLFLDRAQRHEPRLNAFITLDPQAALAQAELADAAIADGAAHTLTGIPVVLKDIFCARGWRTTCGSKILHNFVAPYDAHVVEKLKGAGAVILGKANMDEFAMGSSSESSHFGPVHNPWDLTAVAGGSSGGCAAAVAARLAPGALGTDTGGSIRQPAAMCGISGIKPTYGLVSRYGMIAYASSLDQGGPMAKSAEDLGLMLNVIAGFDQRDSTSLQRAPEDYVRDLDRPITGLRIGIPKEYFAEGLDDDVARAVHAAIAQLEKLGCKVLEVSLPQTRLSVPAYYVLAPAEASSNLARFDGVRYGYRADQYEDLRDMYMKTRAQGFGEEVKRRILVGTYVLSHGYYDAYYLQAQKIRRLIARDFATAFERCDVIVGPTSPSVAFDLGSKTTDPVQMYLSDIYTIGVNLAGLPGMSIPCGFGARQRPVGLQLIGNYFEEARMLNVAHRYQRATDWHARMPSAFEQTKEA